MRVDALLPQQDLQCAEFGPGSNEPCPLFPPRAAARSSRPGPQPHKLERQQGGMAAQPGDRADLQMVRHVHTEGAESTRTTKAVPRVSVPPHGCANVTHMARPPRLGEICFPFISPGQYDVAPTPRGPTVSSDRRVPLACMPLQLKLLVG